ncbi:hypothetical protein EDC04DRAFT_3073183 [Pisolithus marmoratus]|nr:hypothetical protein EDC04DRAFT_3073183 [Pisolithus marmoratus]
MLPIRFKLVFFSPKEETAHVLKEIFSRYPEQVGKIGQYEQCAFITPGVGQFMPGAAANPTVGAPGVLEKVTEDRVEVVVNDRGDMADLRNAITALKQAHSYEEVAYDVYRLENV